MSLEKNIHDDGAIVVGQAMGFAWPFTTVAAWQSADYWVVIGLNGVEVATNAGIKPDGSSFYGEDPTVAYANLYYKTHRQADADRAAALFADPTRIANPKARLMRVFGADKNDMIPAGNFDNTFAVPKNAFGGRGDWMPFGLITLPTIVYAYAKFNGWDVPEMSFAEISDAKNILIRPEEVASVWDRLLSQRIELWQALGEDNYKTQTPMGSVNKLTGKPMLGATVSDKLSQALHFAQSRWENVYAAVGIVGSPTGKGRIPVINQFFDDRVAAEKFVTERQNKNQDDDTAATAKAVIDPYAGLYVIEGLTTDDMVQAIAGALAELNSELLLAKTPVEKAKINTKIKAKFAEDFGVDAETGMAFQWLAKLTEQGIL